MYVELWEPKFTLEVYRSSYVQVRSEGCSKSGDRIVILSEKRTVVCTAIYLFIKLHASN